MQEPVCVIKMSTLEESNKGLDCLGTSLGIGKVQS